MAKKDNEAVDETTTDDTTTDKTADDARDAEVDASVASVADVKTEDIPNVLDRRSDLTPEARADLVSRHPVTPGAAPAPFTQKEQPMPIVTGTKAGSELNDPPIKRYRTTAHPELVVFHPNGDGGHVQFHNNEFATANPEWQAVLDRTPEVDGDVETIEQSGGITVTDDGRVVGLGGADVEPIRASDLVA